MTTAGAIFLLLLAVLLAVLPNPGTAWVVEDAPKPVNCGTIVIETEYSLDDGCEDVVVRRAGRTILLLLLALPMGLAGMILMHRAGRPRGELPAEHGPPW